MMKKTTPRSSKKGLELEKAQIARWAHQGATQRRGGNTTGISGRGTSGMGTSGCEAHQGYIRGTSDGAHQSVCLSAKRSYQAVSRPGSDVPTMCPRSDVPRPDVPRT
jgi:hypothetical protein